jgi:transposase
MADKYIQRKTYPSDVTDEEWGFCAPYLALMKEDVPQRKYPLRVLFNGLRYMVRAGCPWRMLPHDLPPWQAIQQQTLRWIAAGVFQDMAADLRRILRLILERAEEPSAVILDGRTVQSTPESGARAGYDGHKRRKGSKVHIAVDTLGHLLALRVTSANEQERHQVEALASLVQQATGESVELAYVDQGYTGQAAADAAAKHGIELAVVKLSTAKRGFVLLPRRWVVERSFAWMARFRRLARDYERLPQTFAGLHWLAFLTLLLSSLFRQSA